MPNDKLEKALKEIDLLKDHICKSKVVNEHGQRYVKRWQVCKPSCKDKNCKWKSR